MFIREGTEVSVADLLRGIVIQSGNDASVAMAEYIAGDEEAFAGLMTQTAKSLGMNNTNFMNATGLPDEMHYTTAEDLAVLTRALINRFPSITRSTRKSTSLTTIFGKRIERAALAR